VSLPASLQDLIDQFKRLPGIGAKSAQRLAFHVLKSPREDAERLCDAIREVKDRVTYCSVCNNFTDVDPCVYCADPARDHHLVCVVEEPQNVNVIEKTGGFRGTYHVLLGALSPLQGVGPDDLKIKGLLSRIEGDRIEEIILATNPTVEGEATAIYLARLLKPLGVRVTRIATGIPVGSDLDYADELTMNSEESPICVIRSVESQSPSMLPAAYQVPAASLLVLGGVIACFLGYRLFKFVLAIFGFIIGALAASSIWGASDTTYMVIAAIVGGIGGSLLLLAAYFVGVALVGAGLGALIANLLWTQIEGDPHPFVVVLFSVAGALLATWLQRYVIILGTAFGGAWTLIVGALAMMGDKTAMTAAAAGDIWVAYPMNPAPGQAWVPYVWIGLGLAGTLVQMFVTGGQSGRIVKPNKKKKPAE
jgi:recombination protein RecR